MKNLIIILITFLMLSAAGYAQESKQQEEKTPADTVKVEKAKQTDDKRPGRKDRIRKRDRFIDKDGDGINDRRCTGMGLHNCHRKGNNCKHKAMQKEQKQEQKQEKKQEQGKK